MQSLKGKTAIITGAGRGLGKAMALALAKEGVNLGLLARNEATLKEVAAEAKQLHPEISLVWATADVANYEEVKSAILKLVDTLKTVDILINNAGIFKGGSMLELPVSEWEEVIRVNLFGSYYVIHEVLPFILQQGRGDIINIASTAGLKGAAKFSAYGASKAGLINLSESLMQEVRKSNVRVTTVNPSTIATDMALTGGLTDGNPEKVLQPDDLAAVLVNNMKLPQRAFVKDFTLWSTNP